MRKWTDIGESLKKARESMDLELMDVAHSTRIPLSTLRALEESDYSIFPSPAYARSFLSQYSEFLEIDAREWVDAIDTGTELSNVNELEYLKGQNEYIGELGKLSFKKSRTNSSKNRKEQKLLRDKLAIHQASTVFSITALLIAVGLLTYQKFEPTLSDGHATAEAAVLETETLNIETSTLEQNQTPTEQTSISTIPIVATNTTPIPNITQDAEPVVAALAIRRSGPPPRALIVEED